MQVLFEHIFLNYIYNSDMCVIVLIFSFTVTLCYLWRDVTKTGNGQWAMGNGQWGIGNGKLKMGKYKKN